MEIYGSELLKICHHTGRSCEHKHCDSGEIAFLICHVISREHMSKRLCEFMGERPSWRVTTFHVWWPLVWCKLRYKVFNMSRGLKKPRD